MAMAGIGASGCSTKWSGTYSVVNPRSSTLRAFSRYCLADSARGAITPKRNLRSCGMNRTLPGLPAGGPEAVRIAGGAVELVDLGPLDVLDVLQHELGDAVAPVDGVGLVGIGVHEEDLQ